MYATGFRAEISTSLYVY